MTRKVEIRQVRLQCKIEKFKTPITETDKVITFRSEHDFF